MGMSYQQILDGIKPKLADFAGRIASKVDKPAAGTGVVGIDTATGN